MEPTEVTESPVEALDGDTHSDDTDHPNDTDPSNDMVDDELLVEEISIDGMCGVY